MYSPKIDEQYIPWIYRMAKRKGVPMTKYVNEVVEAHIKEEVEEAKEIKGGGREWAI